MIRTIKKIISHRLWTKRWTIGFVEGGIPAIMNSDSIKATWVHLPLGRWFADPFVLEVTDLEIQVLVEDFEYAKGKAVISLLKINKETMKIINRKVLLDLPTHLSFPCILRKDGEIYIYPENCASGKLDMYRYDSLSETVSFYKTICRDSIWDSVITTDFGEPLLFTARQDDYHLDIYTWDDAEKIFVYHQSVRSDLPNSRMGGQSFRYRGNIYYPAQDCSQNYGGAIDIKKIDYNHETQSFTCSTIKKLQSPHHMFQLGLHTLNEYKGYAVIDVQGYRYPRIISIIECISQIKKVVFNGRNTKA